MKIKIKYLSPEMPKIEFVQNKSDWMDLRAAQKLEYKAGDYFLVPLGVAMELPAGYEAHVAPRGSTFKNYGLLQTNSVGVIDESYCGDNDQWFMPVVALREGVIEKHDRICQFRIFEKMPEVEMMEVEMLERQDRGGHGSTGVK